MLSPDDLKRVAIGQAGAVFILSDAAAPDPVAADRTTALWTLTKLCPVAARTITLSWLAMAVCGVSPSMFSGQELG